MSISSVVSSSSSACSCHNCGAALRLPVESTELEGIPIEARKRIEELEEQVKEYSLRAALAADRLERSQNEIINLRRRSDAEKQQQQPSTPPRSMNPPTTATGRISAFLTRKPSNANVNKSTSSGNLSPEPLYTSPRTSSLPPISQDGNVSTSSNITPKPIEIIPEAEDLTALLTQEKTQREEAENQLAAVKSELEDLSVSLFQQANEMVSKERRARMKLEERVAQLEKRDIEKGMRLERLEIALQRISRVRGMLNSRQTF